VTIVLYATPASHPCAVAERALQLKGLDYRRVDQIPVVHRLLQRRRFGIWTVPGVAFDDGTRVGGSRAIIRALDERAPEPPLLPADGAERARMKRAEEWGEQVLQPIARRIALTVLSRAPRSAASYLDGTRLPLPAAVVRPVAALMPKLSRRVNRVADAEVRADLLALPTHLARVDGWIEDGTLGGETVNAADLQIGASLRLLLTFDDLAPALDARPAGALARRVMPVYAGRVPAGALPSAWLAASALMYCGH
jgi:glutathione S-transferase